MDNNWLNFGKIIKRGDENIIHCIINKIEVDQDGKVGGVKADCNV